MVLNNQIATFHKFNNHQAGQSSMLKICWIIDSRCKQHNSWGPNLPWREGQQVFVQNIGILCNRPDKILRDQIRKNPFRDLPVFDHVRYAWRGSQIVFQYVKGSIMIPYQVDACNVHIDVMGNVDTLHFTQVVWTRIHQFYRNDSVFQNKLLVVNVL